MNKEQIKNFYENNIYPIFLTCQNTIINWTDKLFNNNEITYANVENENENNNNDNIFIFGKKTDQITAKQKIENVPYFCYRNHFPTPLINGATDDIGWGCMVRTGQMMICHTLCNVMEKPKNEIIPYFFDVPDAVFSIHKITEYGEKSNIRVGEWFNPSGIGYAIRNIIRSEQDINVKLEVTMGNSGSIYESDILNILDKNKSCLVLIPIMLGTNDKIDKIYYDPLLKCFESKYSVGVIGGKPKHSFYFIGKKENNVFFLDPHTIKPALLSVKDKEYKISLQYLFDFKETFSRHFLYDNEDNIVNYINISELAPSMLLCFLIKSKNDYYNWKEYISKNVNKNSEISIFSIMNNKEMYKNNSSNDVLDDNLINWIECE
jgi:cysteine protease ATG4